MMAGPREAVGTPASALPASQNAPTRGGSAAYSSTVISISSSAGVIAR